MGIQYIFVCCSPHLLCIHPLTPIPPAVLFCVCFAVLCRFRYMGLKLIDDEENHIVQNHKLHHGGSAAVGPPGSEFAGLPVDDAFSTIIQWLYTRIPMAQEARASKGGSIGTS